MQIYLLRHGEAHEREPGMTDADRLLTDAGLRQAAIIADFMAGKQITVDLIVSSPLTRAVQTARQVADVLGVELVTDARIAGPGFCVADLADIACELGNPGALLVVGHEPTISGVIAGLIGGGNIKMSVCSLAMVEGTAARAGSCYLRWLVNPPLIA